MDNKETMTRNRDTSPTDINLTGELYISGKGYNTIDAYILEPNEV